MYTRITFVPVAILLLLNAGCPPKQQLPLNLRASAERFGTLTEFSINGSGFTPSQPVVISLMFEPGRLENTRVISTVTTDPTGSFTASHKAYYLPGPDPGTRNPAFVARDNASGQSEIEEVLSAYWYP